MTATVESLKEVLIPHAECGNEKEYSKMMAKKLSRYTGSGNVKVDVLNNVVGFIGDQSKYTTKYHFPYV